MKLNSWEDLVETAVPGSVILFRDREHSVIGYVQEWGVVDDELTCVLFMTMCVLSTTMRTDHNTTVAEFSKYPAYWNANWFNLMASTNTYTYELIGHVVGDLTW